HEKPKPNIVFVISDDQGFKDVGFHGSDIATANLGVLAAFVRANLVASTGEARRQIRGGGLRVNDEALGDEKAVIGRDALQAGGVVKLSLGKKKHVLLKAV
ncbi:MAG TPA: hypothetical protein VEH77_03110, partial [Roseiarcus sp.]|nr:hypothetical protein [Roseiarcus sp.]